MHRSQVPNVKRLHTELAMASLAAGRHVMLEKPCATSVADGRELIAAVKAAAPAARLMVAENAACWTSVLDVAEALKRGDIGEVMIA
jgi:predicted dehydrogenase